MQCLYPCLICSPVLQGIGAGRMFQPPCSIYSGLVALSKCPRYICEMLLENTRAFFFAFFLIFFLFGRKCRLKWGVDMSQQELGERGVEVLGKPRVVTSIFPVIRLHPVKSLQLSLPLHFISCQASCRQLTITSTQFFDLNSKQ